ncbi:putative peroxisomal acyl-coenzyme A oxidase 1 [Pseudolycoriella hygida]|uniref:Acyl-coenzyme A oxidase n=1 Tax=Pseudolycoriella hygida TaxID=35572 RepID=A0A9Q0MN14_9DIPT|nr:putative peroxisomal acyl-coenzyme A oxidase 1 [Pseudolycoriella hygida]
MSLFLVTMTVKTTLNQDLKEEREKVPFVVEEFTNWFHGGEANVKDKRYLENLIVNNSELKLDLDMSYMSHKEKYEEAVRRATIALKLFKKLREEGFGGANFFEKILLPFSSVLKQGSPISLQFSMFIPGLMKLATPEQQAKWVPRALNLSIIGTYAQTEMGHGTFIRGLETTSTYDPETKEFIIHSPTITAYKWWPGGLGHTVNHAIVFAQLYSLGKHHGLHPFIVQLRDEETHKPREGITIGEIGNKVGFNTVNNGFLGFDKVRIPLSHMLMKNAEIRENGEFVKNQSSILNYGTMTHVRVGIVRDMASLIARAVTIAMRYSIVRRQSPIDPNQPEPKVIEHITQQMKIFPLMAKVFAVKYSADNLMRMYLKVTSEIERGDLERLPELHALSCCLKAVSSNEAVQAVETLRLACGGHGFLTSSGFHDLYTNCTAAQTYEGENTVMLLQTARYLIKVWGQALSGKKLPPTVAYLQNYKQGNDRNKWNPSINGILMALQTTTSEKVALAYKHLEARKKLYSAEEAANQTGVELLKVAELHCQSFLLQSTIEMVEKCTPKVSLQLANVLRDILELYAVDLALRFLGDLLQFNNITSNDVEHLQQRMELALKSLRNSALGIVDGFDFPDYVLSSTLGAYDGNVYERLLEAAKKSPLNHEDVNKSFHLYLKPFIKSNL